MRARRTGTALAALAATALLMTGMAMPAAAEVATSDASGFSISQKRVLTGVTAQDAWVTMTRRVGTWWDAAHTWGGDASKLHLEAKANGCFCEWLPNGGWAEHLRVVYMAPGRELRMRGGLGPLMQMGLDGTMTWSLNPLVADDAGNPQALEIEWRYIVSGHRPEGFNDIAPAVDAVLGQQIDRLVNRLSPPAP